MKKGLFINEESLLYIINNLYVHLVIVGLFKDKAT